MGRTAINREVYSGDTKTEQKDDIVGDEQMEDRDPEIVRVDAAAEKKEYNDALAFGEEPVTIRLDPSSDKNAATVFQVFCNGTPCEVLVNGKWRQAPNGFIPVGQVLTIKRKYLAIIASAKIDNVSTQIIERTDENPENRVKRFTSVVQSFSVLEDTNPRGHAWLTEIIRRNM